MTILQIVKTLLEITDEAKDSILEVYIYIITQRVLNYCNIKELPEQLNYTVAQIAADMYKEPQQGIIIAGSGAVSSISEGGRTVSFDVGSKISKNITATADERISTKTEISRFRQLYLI